MRTVPINPQDASTNWSAYAPDLPGCIATGRTVEETLVRLKDAIQFHIEGMRQDGDEIPEIFTDEFSLDVQAAVG